jgi:thiol-disulfide isomerase/thioredoxin
MTDTPTDSRTPTRERPIFVWAERLVTLALLAFVLVRLTPQLEALTGVGPDLGKAPPLSVVTLEGDTLGAADLAGKVVVVNFWATWCRWCRLEMPSLEHLYQRHAGDDLVILGLATDAGSVAPIRAFLRDRGITYPVSRATAAEERAFGGIGGIPTTFVLDRRGMIRYRVVGYFAPPALEAAVSRLLDERSPAQETR